MMANSAKPLLVVGATIVYDTIFRVDCLPRPGQTARILQADDNPVAGRQPGGTAFNIALGLARLRARVAIAHPVGYDFAGSEYERLLRESGVDLDGLLVNESSPSGTAYVFGALDGSTVCFSSVTPPPVGQISAAVLERAGLIVMTPLVSPIHQHAARYAQSHDIPLAACGIASAEVLGWLPGLVMLSINEHEMKLLADIEPGLTPRALSSRMQGPLFITRGSGGCSVYLREDHLADIPVIEPRQLVDTTGAGDAFFAATLAGLRQGFDPLDSARIGAAAGSLVVEAWGCQVNLPDWSALAGRVSGAYPRLAARIRQASEL